MVYELSDTTKVQALFEGWEETLIYSCLQKVMGKVYVTDMETPRSAFAFVGCFGFYAGEVDEELIRFIPWKFSIVVPQNDAWAKAIETIYPDCIKKTRYAIRKDTQFDKASLQKNLELLPEGYEIRVIDAELYDQCLKNNETADFVSVFETKENFLKLGRGMVIVKDGKIVAGASSYTRYREGIEIEVDTMEEERRKHLATVACSALILRCLDEGLYPSWDAANMNSVHLAEKLGYQMDHEYTAYWIIKSEK